MAAARSLLVLFLFVGVVSPALISHGASVTTLGVREDFFYTVTIPSFTFLGTSYTQIHIQENGVITFDAVPFGGVASQYTLDKKWIAPYGADIGGGSFGNILHETFGTSDTSTIQFVSTAVDAIFTTGSFVPTSVIVVTWQNVRLYPSATDTRESTFQAVLATDGTKSYALFLYGTLQWTNAVIGIGSGSSAVYHEVCQSKTYDAKFLASTSQTQCSAPGVFVFRVDQTTWQTAGKSCTTIFPSDNCSTSSANANANRNKRCSP